MKHNEKLREQRAKLVNDQRDILKAADTEARGMTVDEMATFDTLDAEIVALKQTIDRADAYDAEQRSIAHAFEPVDTEAPATVETRTIAPETRVGTASDEYRSAMQTYLRAGSDQELRALSEGTDTAGGYLVPDEWANQIIQARDEVNVMRQLATVVETSTGTFNLPTVTSQGTAAWTSEGASISESDPAFGIVQFSAYKAARLVKVSNELLADNAFDLTGYLAKEFGRSIGALDEAAFVEGTGSSQPQGVFYNATVGVTAASATAITGDELINLFHALDPQYRDRSSWLMNDSTILLVRKLTDDNNQYLWQPGLAAGTPDTLMGRPVYASSSVAAAAANNKPVMIADLTYYWIADRAGLTVRRLDELYQGSGQVGFIGEARTDGAGTLATAAQVIQMAAS